MHYNVLHEDGNTRIENFTVAFSALGEAGVLLKRRKSKLCRHNIGYLEREVIPREPLIDLRKRSDTR